MNDVVRMIENYRRVGVPLVGIVTHEEAVVPEWGFLVYFENELYIMIRKEDLLRAIADKKSLGRLAKEFPHILDAPITDSRVEVSRICRGTFVWSRKLSEI